MFSQVLSESRLVAIVRLDCLDQADRIVETLLGAGVRCIELTLTNRTAPVWVSRLVSENASFRTGQAYLGIGSVRSLDEAKLVLDAGCQFVVTPIMRPEVIGRCVEAKVPIACGAYTPTEIATAWECGADLVKVFPAKGLGPGYIKDLLAPMPYLKLMPTGGIDAKNARDYLSAGALAVGVGGTLCSPSLVEQGDWESIRKAAVSIVHACRE
ncbi:MAG: bifunctional 4-hydroxy-2-oxoglutarate aldolase/2-dehydro-3-deoxy-phosphogluconate aldolase [Planctomycetota bacterium]|nr:bifunctional 4-hydroxy-2-oxoglutarate aldolase/2-dehydro-3-deoxy-phosphogluconate aldolase [Planctomycetota bacterium]